MPQQAEVVDGHDERDSRTERRAEGRAVEKLEAARRPPQPERVPERIASKRREPPGAARREADELQARSAGERAEEAADVPRCPRPRLHERRRVDSDPHETAASRTA